LNAGDAVSAFVHLSHALRQAEVAESNEDDDESLRQQVRKCNKMKAEIPGFSFGSLLCNYCVIKRLEPHLILLPEKLSFIK